MRSTYSMSQRRINESINQQNKTLHDKIKDQFIIRSHFEIYEISFKHRIKINNTSINMKINKGRTNETNEKRDVFDKKFENKTTNKRYHKKITKVFYKNY